MLVYRSHGKFLITGEYLVMKGVPALASPLRTGQTLKVEPLPSVNHLTWESYFNGKIHFSCMMEIQPLRTIETTEQETAERLLKILQLACQMNPDFLKEDTAYHIVSEADFEAHWGMGSSSTLISNIAFWANVDPYKLNAPVFNGSGYDILCARASGPLIYMLCGNKPLARMISFNPPFSDYIYFVYTGNKTDTRKSLQLHLEAVRSAPQKELDLIGNLSEKFALATELEEFEEYMELHERKMAKILGLPLISEERFPDFPGKIKSLGAWGGDFIMVTWRDDFFSLYSYMRKKNAGPVFGFNELILNE